MDKDDLNDDIYDEGEFEEDGTSEIIRKAFEESMKDDDDEDDGGFDQPFEEPETNTPDVVSPDEGRDLLDKADIQKNKAKREELEDDDPAPKSEDEDPAPKSEDDPDGEGDDDPTPVDLTAADVNTLLDGVPDDRKTELSRRLKDADAALAPFQTDYVQEQMKAHGSNPSEVAGRLVELATFAAQKPDEYVAWVVSQSASGDKAGEVLERAAKHLGFKVVKDDDDDDDMFEDPELKALREENRLLKEGKSSDTPTFGPDTPDRTNARTATQQLNSFTTEKDETGQLKRPHFEHLRPRIAELAKSHRDQTGAAVSVQDLQTFYDKALEEAQKVFQPTPTPTPTPSAAQTIPSVSQRDKKAAAARRAQRASKPIDGSGQGASRRPALSESASLEDTIRHFASKE